MATALQQQLAAIAANSTHQLDLKAQKTRHSKSLLFEPREAASQSFDTVYQICHEGFEELCMLDARFRQFASNIFSEQSKSEDRTQLTQQENDDLDRILESFLGLAGGRLLLKPAMKAVEWLVRRFRVQDYNTECVLLTFLPYHTSYIFPTLLSILPSQLPPMFRFLSPYVASLQCPPRHAILSAIVSTQQFFTIFSAYVLRVSKARHHSAILLGFWASITAQAVNSALDASRSGRDHVRQQREEDLLTRLLPILQNALGVRGVPELYLGSCMIITILATKASLVDKALDAMMEAVAGSWSEQTFHDGVTCLAIIAEEKAEVLQSSTVTRALARNDKTVDTIVDIGSSHRVEKLVEATAMGLVDEARKGKDVAPILMLQRLLENVAMQEPSALRIAEKLLFTSSEPQLHDSAEIRNAVGSLLASIAETPLYLNAVRTAARNLNTDLDQLRLPALSETISSSNQQSMLPQTTVVDITQGFNDDAHLDMLMNALPDLSGQTTSFLVPTATPQYTQYLSVFERVILSATKIEQFFDLPSLNRNEWANSPELFTFLSRVWTSSTVSAARTKALESANQQISAGAKGIKLDMNFIIPYVFTALTDPNQKVRRAAAKLCTSLSTMYESHGRSAASEHTIYNAEFYNAISSADAKSFIDKCIRQEDCVLDRNCITRSLVEIFNGEKSKAPLKTAVLHAISGFFTCHARMTPVFRVKIAILRFVSQLGKVLGDVRTKVLLPTIKEWCDLPEHEVLVACEQEHVHHSEVDKAVASCLSRRTTEELQFLESIVVGGSAVRETLVDLVFERLKHILPHMTSTARIHITTVLLDVAQGSSERSSHALEVLRTADLGADTLAQMIETLPKAGDGQEQSPVAKRQRVSRADIGQARQNNAKKLQDGLRRLTLVLELVEGSKTVPQPEMVRALFQLLSELHQYKTALGSELVYVQNLLFSCLHTAANTMKTTPNNDFDAAMVRTDLIVDSIRTTSSPQIYNSGLLLISSLASWNPDLVLHSVMPLFTFMSSTLLKQSDDYSAHVADQTIASVVPPLAASLKKSGKSVVVGAADLLLSFTAAYEHIPLHRRANLFGKLVDILGPDEVLFAVVATSIAKYSRTNGQLPAFITTLVNRFSASSALTSLQQNLDLVLDASKPRRNLSNLLLGLDENPQDVEETTESLIMGLTSLVHDSTLRKRLAHDLASNDGLAISIRSKYAKLLEQTINLSQDLSSHPTLRAAGDSLLSAMLGLMPTKDFMESSAQLMQVGSDLARQQVFECLENRVLQAKQSDIQSREVFLEALPNCCVFLQAEQPVATRHAAISCIDQICVKYGKLNRSAVMLAAEQVAGPAALRSSDHDLSITSILCLASMVEVLGEEIVGILPQLLPHILENLGSAQGDVSMQKAAFAFLSALLDEVPWILSSSYLDSALTSAAEIAISETHHRSSPATEFCTLVAGKVSAMELFSAIDRAWLASDSINTKYGLLKTVLQAIQNNNKSTITKNAQNLFSIMLKAFGLRSQLGEEYKAKNEILGLINQSGLAMTLKLNDTTFRPFFAHLVEWAALAGDDRVHRQLSLYHFALTLFEQLKSIVTSYASFILDDCSAVLRSSSHQNALHTELLHIVLQTLSSSFLHDQDDFWQTPSHFDVIAAPLLNQLSFAKALNVSEHAIPAITAFVSAASSPDHLKTVNSTIMSLMRHDDAAVRLAAVQCERKVTEKLNFDWLTLLPEMLPFISELQEDDDEAVERETLRWVRQIEDITGESLEGMLA